AVARDRDKTRQQVLENLGWTIIRAWSTDWWYDPDTAIEQVDSALRELLRSSREQSDESKDDESAARIEDALDEPASGGSESGEEPHKTDDPFHTAVPNTQVAMS